MRPAIGSVVVALALAACGGPAGETTPTTSPTSTTMSTTPQGDITGEAVADLAARLRVPAAEIEVIRSEEITWSDGSLGCPQPGMSYTQAMVDGHRVILGHDGRIYLYHAGQEGSPFLCESDEDDGGHDFVPPPGIDI